VSKFEVERHPHLSAAEAWERVTDWERHGRFIPYTTVRLTSPPDDAGRVAGFVARTTVGPLHFDDPMDITWWEPPAGESPGVCRIVKRGKVVAGWAVLTVTAEPDGCSVRWRENASVRFTGPLLAWPTKVAAGFAFGRLVDGLLGGQR
jgi:hypothetical protein